MRRLLPVRRQTSPRIDQLEGGAGKLTSSTTDPVTHAPAVGHVAQGSRPAAAGPHCERAGISRRIRTPDLVQAISRLHRYRGGNCNLPAAVLRISLLPGLRSRPDTELTVVAEHGHACAAAHSGTAP